jgi:nitrate reductase delta subunit
MFEYPRRGDYGALLTRCIDALRHDCPAAIDSLAPLRDHVATMSLEQVQELYTRTFDINPVCTLEIGWHIYGEDYARGALLVKLREQLRRMNIPESCELPDHLTHVLLLIGRMTGEDADELAARYLLPGLDKMLEGLVDGEHAYRALIETVSKVVRTDHDVEVVAPREQRSAPPDWKNRLPMFGAQGCGMREGRKP